MPKEAVTAPRRSSLGPTTQRFELEIAANFFNDAQGVVEARAGKQQGELLPAVAGRDVRPAEVRRQDPGEQFEQMIAHEMAESIVDRLEAVEVGQRQTKAGAGFARALDFLLQGLIEETPVAQLGQRVDHRYFSDLGNVVSQRHDLQL